MLPSRESAPPPSALRSSWLTSTETVSSSSDTPGNTWGPMKDTTPTTPWATSDSVGSLGSASSARTRGRTWESRTWRTRWATLTWGGSGSWAGLPVQWPRPTQVSSGEPPSHLCDVCPWASSSLRRPRSLSASCPRGPLLGHGLLPCPASPPPRWVGVMLSLFSSL